MTPVCFISLTRHLFLFFKAARACPSNLGGCAHATVKNGSS